MSRVRGRKNKTAPPQEQPAAPPSVGERLRQVRVGRGLDVATVAEQLHLKQCTVVALEEEDFDRLPARVFVRGYYRNYARLMGLPVDDLLRQFDQRCPEGESCSNAPPVAPRNVRREIRSNHILVRAVTWGMAVLLAAAVVLWWRDYAARDRQADQTLAEAEQPAATPKLAEAPPAASLATASAPPVPEPPAAEPALPPQSQFTPGPAVAADSPAPPPAAEAPATKAPVAAAPPEEKKPEPPAPPKPELVVKQDSWVDIRGAERSFKRVGILKAGTRLALDGQPPWHMVIGNARGVTLLVDGRPYDLASHTRRNVARLTLNP